MLEIIEIYTCKSCVNIVEVVEGGGAANLVCCGEKMKLLNENTIDAASERHVCEPTSRRQHRRLNLGHSKVSLEPF
ncbi:MAG: desulfoferrodoxin FeS4 iron-binding domain-containing protein [Desulfobacterales bacterium]|nr:desulfoferrodoxin FeS4 iron-binding domain-containing protein [Desulfobacterales bacterium]